MLCTVEISKEIIVKIFVVIGTTYNTHNINSRHIYYTWESFIGLPDIQNTKKKG